MAHKLTSVKTDEADLPGRKKIDLIEFVIYLDIRPSMASPRFLTPGTIVYIINIPGGKDKSQFDLQNKCSKAKQMIQPCPLPTGENRRQKGDAMFLSHPKNIKELILWELNYETNT